VDWLTAAFKDLAKSVPIVVDKSGPASAAADDLERAGFTIQRLESLDVRKACGRFYDALADNKRIAVRADERLDEAVKHATRKALADSWAWHRDSPGGELLMAVSLAYATAVTEEVSFPPFDVR
jgi:hypothetical protein